MKYENMMHKGLKRLRENDYENAIRYFEISYEEQYSHQCHEVLFSSILHHIKSLKNDNLSAEMYLEKLRKIIMNSITPHQTLGFTFSTVTRPKLNKKYKILALWFHPDKSSVSSEAFIKINEAYQALCQSPEPKVSGFSNDFSNVYSKTSEYNHENFQNSKAPVYYGGGEVCCGINPFLAFSFFPMLMLLFLSIYSTFDIFSQNFSFYPTVLFNKQCVSRKYSFTFWISEFEIEAVDLIEKEAEEEYIKNLKSTCLNQLRRKEYLMAEASVNDGMAMNRYLFLASEVDLSACEVLSDLEIAYDT